VIGAVRERLGSQLPLVGVFDTAYFARLPESAFRYAIPSEWFDALGVRRYGFHGIAHRYMCQQARALLGVRAAQPRIISLQLGRGCSATASVNDQPIATSMGFTPLEGLVMGTRSGDFDPGAMLYVMERTGMTADGMRRALNEGSGLLGLSGRTADMRELLALERAKDPAATLAIEVFCRRVRHYVGGYLAELGGADAIVFGGGIGENCPGIRQRIAGRLEWAGIRLRTAPAATRTAVTALHESTSAAAVYVVPVDEGAVIADEARSVLQRGAGV
jgi:acetate kinase